MAKPFKLVDPKEKVTLAVKVKDFPSFASKIGQVQGTRAGTEEDWTEEEMIKEFKDNGFKAELRPIMQYIFGEDYLADGNRSMTALLKLAKTNPHVGEIEVPLVVWPSSTPAEKREEIRIAAARLTKELNRADFTWVGVRIAKSFPGEIPELTLVERLGIGRFRAQYPNALQLKADGTVEKIKNRQALQDIKRLAYHLPEFCTVLYCNYLLGKKPGIRSDELTTLKSDWAEDTTAHPELHNGMSIEEVQKAHPTSKLLARIAASTDAPSGQGRKPGSSGAMKADDLKAQKASMAGGAADVVLAFGVAGREPGLDDDQANKDLKQLALLTNRICDTDGPVGEELQALRAQRKVLVTAMFARQAKVAAERSAALAAATKEKKD